MRIEPVLLDGAAECGLRSFVALGGFLGDDAMVEPEILSYEGPYGVGYLVARFGPRPGERGRRGMSEPAEDAPGPADYAFSCVRSYVAGGRAPEPPEDAFYERRAACFVTLKKHGELRGCIGTLEPAEASLGREIARNAHSSAMRDPRFPPVTRRRVRRAHLLRRRAQPQRAVHAGGPRPARYGVIVESGSAARRAAAGPRGHRHRRPAGRASPCQKAGIAAGPGLRPAPLPRHAVPPGRPAAAATRTAAATVPDD